MAAQRFTGHHGASQDSSAFAVFWLQERFWLQLWLQIWLQDFPRTAMFFYRFGCFISLVTNVTKKSLESFWDRKLHANRLHRWSKARGVLGPFFLVTAGILVTRGSMAFTALHRTSRGFMAAQRFTGHHGTSQDSSAFARVSATRAILVTALSYSFCYRIFLEPLCFSIDLAISSLL